MNLKLVKMKSVHGYSRFSLYPHFKGKLTMTVSETTNSNETKIILQCYQIALAIPKHHNFGLRQLQRSKTSTLTKKHSYKEILSLVLKDMKIKTGFHLNDIRCNQVGPIMESRTLKNLRKQQTI